MAIASLPLPVQALPLPLDPPPPPPPPLRYPLSHVAFPFTRGLMQLFYGHSLLTKLRGILSLARCSLAPSTVRVGASLPHAKKA